MDSKITISTVGAVSLIFSMINPHAFLASFIICLLYSHAVRGKVRFWVLLNALLTAWILAIISPGLAVLIISKLGTTPLLLEYEKQIEVLSACVAAYLICALRYHLASIINLLSSLRKK